MKNGSRKNIILRDRRPRLSRILIATGLTLLSILLMLTGRNNEWLTLLSMAAMLPVMIAVVLLLSGLFRKKSEPQIRHEAESLHLDASLSPSGQEEKIDMANIKSFMVAPRSRPMIDRKGGLTRQVVLTERTGRKIVMSSHLVDIDPILADLRKHGIEQEHPFTEKLTSPAVTAGIILGLALLWGLYYQVVKYLNL
ncbi:MAG: hypothetical protein ABIJ46_02645 [bacterium]